MPRDLSPVRDIAASLYCTHMVKQLHNLCKGAEELSTAFISDHGVQSQPLLDDLAHGSVSTVLVAHTPPVKTRGVTSWAKLFNAKRAVYKQRCPASFILTTSDIEKIEQATDVEWGRYTSGGQEALRDLLAQGAGGRSRALVPVDKPSSSCNTFQGVWRSSATAHFIAEPSQSVSQSPFAVRMVGLHRMRRKHGATQGRGGG